MVVNGHRSETWKTPDAELPPNGWFARSADGKLVAWSRNVDGHRADYVDSPAYLYADGRGQFTRLQRPLATASLSPIAGAGGTLEVIPVGTAKASASAWRAAPPGLSPWTGIGGKLGPPPRG